MTIHESELFYPCAPADLLFVMSEPPEGSYCKITPSFCSSLHLLTAAAPGLHSVPPGPQRHPAQGMPGGSSAPAAALLGTTPAQHSWPSATCSHLTLFALAQLLLPKAPPEATWKMRSVDWSVLKINQEKPQKHFTRWLRSCCFGALGTPGRQVEGLELAVLQEMAHGIPSSPGASG